MHSCKSFSTSRLFHRFLMCTRTGCTGYHNTLSKKKQLGSHIIIQSQFYAFPAMNFCRKPKFISSQWLCHPNPYHTTLHCGNIPWLITLVGRECSLSYYIAEVYAALLLCSAIPNLGILVRYTVPHYTAELYPNRAHCWDISNFFTTLGNSRFYRIDELYRNLTHCWGMPCLNTLLSYSESFNFEVCLVHMTMLS